ncbi:MAG: zinc ribbon domain-containing protein [Solirubrobacteraceae bacterium]|nr:zinc ribbon domain-containing protein [Solirubrobacteraceae bacterium]
MAKRDRLTEQFTLLQAELGGIFYEMAIRDHIRLDVLTQKAAALQRVDGELAEVEAALRGDLSLATERCPSCGSGHLPGARFCSSCGHGLQAEALPAVNGSSPS